MQFIDRPRGPYMLGAREAPGGILGSLGSPRGYASASITFFHCSTMKFNEIHLVI